MRAAIVVVTRLQPDLITVAALPDAHKPPELVGLLQATQHSLVLLIGDHPTSISNETHSNLLRLSAAELDTGLPRLLHQIKPRISDDSNQFATRVLARARPHRSARGMSLPSPRQMEVLQHLQAGQSHRDIARAMGISQSTVDRHVADLYVKLHVASREQAIARAAELAWLLSPEKLHPPESTAGSEHDGHDVCEASESRR